jgi:hypothetical protein
MCDNLYHHKYIPTIFNTPNIPWYVPNEPPYAQNPPLPNHLLIHCPPTIGTEISTQTCQPLYPQKENNYNTTHDLKSIPHK